MGTGGLGRRIPPGDSAGVGVVRAWLARNDIIRPEAGWNAEVAAAINNRLEQGRQSRRNPELVREVRRELKIS